MKSSQKGFTMVLAILAVLLVGVVGVSGFMVYQSRHKDQSSESAKSYNSHALMAVTSSGGLCDGPCNHPVHNLYADGKFEGYKKLSNSEVSKLRRIINTTDFLKYATNPNPKCESFSDGSDQVLLFPQKYGDKTFTTCMLDIPANDTAFSYINKLIESHYIQQN